MVGNARYGLVATVMAGCSAIVTVAAGADADTTRNGRSRGELYIKVSVGVGLTDDSDLKIRQSDTDPALNPTNLVFHDVEWEDHSLSGPSARYTDIRLGYFFKRKPWMGIAVDFLHYKVFAEVEQNVAVTGTNQGDVVDTVQPMQATVAQYDVSNGVNLIPASFVARHRAKRSAAYPNGRIQPYVGFGVGPTLLYTQSVVNEKRRKGPYEFGNLAFQAIGGAQFQVARAWDVFFEYKYTYTEVNGSIDDGSSRAELCSHHFTVGGGFHW